MSNFNKVKDFMCIANHPVHNSVQKHIFTDKPDRVNLRLSLIQEEVKELETAIKTKNMHEVIDALTDILYVTYGAGAEFGINLDDTFARVHESNMSKFCSTEQEAKDTVNYYENNISKTGNNIYKSPCYRYNELYDKYVVFNADTDKILKSIKYNPVEFDID